MYTYIPDSIPFASHIFNGIPESRAELTGAEARSATRQIIAETAQEEHPQENDI